MSFPECFQLHSEWDPWLRPCACGEPCIVSWHGCHHHRTLCSRPQMAVSTRAWGLIAAGLMGKTRIRVSWALAVDTVGAGEETAGETVGGVCPGAHCEGSPSGLCVPAEGGTKEGEWAGSRHRASPRLPRVTRAQAPVSTDMEPPSAPARTFPSPPEKLSSGKLVSLQSAEGLTGPGLKQGQKWFQGLPLAGSHSLVTFRWCQQSQLPGF